jgi:hypothetical protein
LSNIDDRVDSMDADLSMESGGEPDTKAIRVNSSVALRPGCVERALGLAFEVVMDGSVADARRSLGLRELRLLFEESLLCMRPESEEAEPIVDRLCWWVAEQLTSAV